MSENFMGGYGAPTPEPETASEAPARDPRILIGGGIGLAVVALGGAYFLLHGGGGSDTPSSAPFVRHTVSSTPTATVIPVSTASVAKVKAFKGDVGRDPFQALVTPTTPPAPKTTAPKPTETTLPNATPTSPGTVIGPPGSTPVATLPVTSGTPTPAPTTSAPVKVMVVLKAIAYPHGSTDPYVVVSFSGQQYMLKTGDTAGGNLKLLAIAPDDGTATFMLGDQTFDLHIGQSYVD
jgi:hypothetical protein